MTVFVEVTIFVEVKRGHPGSYAAKERGMG
jgi:hypothetical protein